MTLSGGTVSGRGVVVGSLGNGVLTLGDNSALLLDVATRGAVILPTAAGASGTFNYGTGGPAPEFTAFAIQGGPNNVQGPVASVVNINHTGVAILPVLQRGLNVTKQGSGRTFLLGQSTYVGTTTISAGELLFTDAAPFSSIPGLTFGTVTVAAGASIGYMATRDVQLRFYNGLIIGGGPGSVLSTSVGFGPNTAAIIATPPALHPITALGPVTVNVYGIPGVTPAAGTNEYTLVQGNTNGFPPLATLGLVLNNSNFTIDSVSRLGVRIIGTVTRVTPITTAHWVGGFSRAPTLWAASDGSTASNWATTAGGAAQPLTPGPGATLTFAGPTPMMMLGANMSIGGLIVADAVNLNVEYDGFVLTLGSGGVTMNAGVPASALALDVTLGASQTWTNDSANPLTMNGLLRGTGVTWTKSGAGTVVLSGTGTHPYFGGTSVNQGTLLVSGALNGSVTTVTGAGSTLGGTGLTGPVTVGSGALVQGGDGATAAGTLSFGNGLSLLDGSIIRLTLGAAGAHSSLARVIGTWSFDSDQAFTLTPGAPVGFYNNVISGLGGTETGLSTISTWHTDLGAGFISTFTYDGAGGVDLNVSVIPEPGSAALLLLGLPLLGRRPRRSRGPDSRPTVRHACNRSAMAGGATHG